MIRIISFILTLFYITLTSGAYINIHYCGGDIQSIDLSANNEMCCCGIDYGTSGCCENEIVLLKIDVDQNVSITQNIISELYSINYISNTNNTLIEIEYDNIKFNDVIIPPPKPEPIWLLNCTLTFYG